VKLLFDQNISFRVVNRLEELFPGCDQLRKLGLENKSDREIWEFAKQHGFTIVTFDSDFYDLVTLYGNPPKVIWLRIGNTRKETLISVFLENQEIIKSFVLDKVYEEIGCLEIN
jgi:predicted nuclease of predicted toxin-antitoxin system